MRQLTFRKQVRVVDLLGREDVTRIVDKIEELSQSISPSCSCEERAEETKPFQISTATVIQAANPEKVEMDKAGYFVIIPQTEKGIITVGHYSYDNRLLKVVEGKDARSIYLAIIENRWIKQLSHAAYLGRELMKPELSLNLGFKYIQDGA